MSLSARLIFLLDLAGILAILYGISGVWSEYMWFASLGYRRAFYTLFF